MTPLKKLATCAATWLVIGLVGGVFYREFTKAHDFTGWTQLKVVHTHSLALGFMLTLIALLLEQAFTLSQHRGAFATYFWGFNLGLLLTIAMLVVHGIPTSPLPSPASPASGTLAFLSASSGSWWPCSNRFQLPTVRSISRPDLSTSPRRRRIPRGAPFVVEPVVNRSVGSSTRQPLGAARQHGSANST